MAEPAVSPRPRAMPNQSIEETAIATRTSGTTELAPSAAEAAAQHEIQGAIILARKFPRNEDQAYAALMRSCQRTSFADGASYSFPRGGAAVEGPSVKLAREAARLWGNILVRLEVLRDDDDSRHIRAVAWDLQTNARHTAEDQFQKLIFRKGKNGAEGRWVKPDERDLRELTNRRGAILERNCILKLMPPDMIDEARQQANDTLVKGAAQDPDGERKKAIRAFSELNVTPEMLEAYLKHPLAQSTPAEIADLRKIYASIRDGNSTWSDYVERPVAAGPEKGNLDMAGMSGKEIPPRDEPKPAEATPEREPVRTRPSPQHVDWMATKADYDEITLRAKKAKKNDAALEALCMQTCGRALGELTHEDANAVILALAKA